MRRTAGLAGALTVAAGLVHATAAGTHGDERTLVLLFTLTAAAQVGLGALMVARPSRPALAAGALVNLAVVAAWTASRTTGVALIAALARPEAAGVADVTATVVEVLAVLSAVLALRAAAERPARPQLSPALVLVLVPALVGMAAPSDHPAGHHAAAGALAADPIFRGADTSHATKAQLEAAKRLIETTRAAVTARFPDRASLVAAGYRSIGDGALTRYDHFVNASYLNDGHELDPDRVESIVMERTATGWKVASAMYILETGKTMADVPDVAGSLTAWHDHQNLCWDESGTRLAGLLVGGACVPGGTFRPTPPMLHVWLADRPCGPFEGIEGHGVDCATAHSH